VVDVAKTMEGGGEQQPQQRGGAITPSQDPRAMLMSLTENAKNPDELAQKLQMIDPRQQNQILLQLQQVNPTLFSKVVKAMQAANTPQPKSQVDMRPLPEQKPPRREESPV
jgi:hypothetical protein